MAALSGPASTMTVLLGETTADFFTKRSRALRESDRTKYTLQPGKWIAGGGGTSLENILHVPGLDDDGVAAVRGFPRLTEAALEICERGLHGASDNQIG